MSREATASGPRGCEQTPGTVRRYPARARWVRTAAARTRSDAAGLVTTLPARVGATVPTATLDRLLDDLEQAVAEVLANAVEHGSHPGDDMEVAVSPAGDGVRVRVVDAARGAPERPSASVRPRAPAMDAERGRGLGMGEQLVDEIRREDHPHGGLVTELWIRPRRREA